MPATVEPTKNGTGVVDGAGAYPGPVGTGRVLARGLLRRCPVCGSGSLFTRWFVLAERCPGCRLRFQRIEGHWLGALGLNTIVSFTALFVVVVASLVLDHPDYHSGRLAVVAVVTAVVVPLVFYPSSKTMWTAIDVLMRPLEPGEADPEAPRRQRR